MGLITITAHLPWIPENTSLDCGSQVSNKGGFDDEHEILAFVLLLFAAPVPSSAQDDADSARDYLSAGAVAVGIGSPLLGDAADGGSLTDLRVRARALLDRLAASG